MDEENQVTRDRLIGPVIVGFGARGCSKSSIILDITMKLRELGAAIVKDQDTGYYVLVTEGIPDPQINEILKRNGFKDWPIESFTPAHALAYDQEAYQRMLEEFKAMEIGPAPERKTPKQEKDDLRKFLERRQGRSRFK